MAALCVRCKKNQAVLFVSRMENGEMKSEGYCLKCAKELGMKPIDDVLNNLGLKEEDLDAICEQANELLGGELMNVDQDNSNIGETGTDNILRRLYGNLFPHALQKSEPSAQEQAGPTGPNRQPRQGGKNQEKKYLNAFCIDLTAKAKAGQLDGLIGRETELQRTMQILNRRLKNNPCLIGEPGVGKTAIVEGLAQQIARGNAPYKLLDKEIWQLDMTALVAGTQYRGQMEGRMKGLLDEIKVLGNIILFIDEVHSIVGAGDAEGGMNAANILKPALSRGDIQVIGATTFTEYRKHIEKDSALERRFQPVTVEEPSIEDSIAIATGVAHYYEAYHSVIIPKAMARQAVLLSERYITDRYLPDKAIDLLDEAAADLNLNSPVCREMESLNEQLNRLKAEERLSAVKESTDMLEAKRKALIDGGLPELTVDNLARIIELWTKIPAGKIKEQEFSRLIHLADRLKARIVGQDQAVDAVCSAIRRRRAGISDSRRPISFLFTGPTGVGKTELVKQLSRELFDGPEALVRLDMSEFMEKHAVSRIIGSPPGYVGYDEAGQLTETVRRRPYCVILFDEIEKAHPDVMNILLQILDDGHITDAHGRQVNFANAVLIMTSNAGSDEKGAGSMGFDRSSNEQAKDKAMKALKAFLRPEFLNRLDDVICFEHLSEESMTKIAHILLKELKASMAEKGIGLTWSEAAAQQLAKMSYSETYRARNLRRCIETDVEDRIVDLIMAQQGAVTRISVGCRSGKLTVQAK